MIIGVLHVGILFLVSQGMLSVKRKKHTLITIETEALYLNVKRKGGGKNDNSHDEA